MIKKAILHSLIIILSVFMIALVYNCKNSIEDSDYFNPNVLEKLSKDHFIGVLKIIYLKERYVNTGMITNSHFANYT